MSARQIALYVCLAGFLIGKALSTLFIFGASTVPDPTTGRTEAYVFARIISSAPSYITLPQVIAISAGLTVGILGFLVWSALSLKHYLGGVSGKAVDAANERIGAVTRERRSGFGQR